MTQAECVLSTPRADSPQELDENHAMTMGDVESIHSLVLMLAALMDCDPLMPGPQSGAKCVLQHIAQLAAEILERESDREVRP